MFLQCHSTSDFLYSVHARKALRRDVILKLRCVVTLLFIYFFFLGFFPCAEPKAEDNRLKLSARPSCQSLDSLNNDLWFVPRRSSEIS